MKLKLWITSVILGFIVIYMIISKVIILRDIILLYILILVPTIVLLTFGFLIRKKIPFKDFIKAHVFRHLLTVIFCLGFFIYIISSKPILKKTAINDLDFMIESLENIHPNIYQEISKDSFQLHYERIKEDLPIIISNVDFYAICVRLTSYFKTAHTKPMANIIENGMQRFFRNNFPYEIKIIENRIFILNKYTLLDHITLGSEIIEINGRNVAQLIYEWSQLASYENEAYRNHQLTNRAHIGIWNNFRSFRIKYKEYGTGKLKKKTVNGGLISNFVMGHKKSMEKRPTLFFKEISPEIGYIGFFSFHDLETYKSFFKSTFIKLKNNDSKNLIIDIRGNQGGHTIIGRELMQYIFHQPFAEVDSSIRKVSNELIATGKVDRILGADKKVPGKIYPRTFKLIQLNDNPVRFNGNTYLLIDNATFSAGQGFASSYKCYGNGTIIGEETGGVTVNFADVHFFNLPNTSLQVMTSWEKAYFPCGVDNNRGVLPDYVVANSINDYIEKRDRALDFTLNLINNE